MGKHVLFSGLVVVGNNATCLLDVFPGINSRDKLLVLFVLFPGLPIGTHRLFLFVVVCLQTTVSSIRFIQRVRCALGPRSRKDAEPYAIGVEPPALSPELLFRRVPIHVAGSPWWWWW